MTDSMLQIGLSNACFALALALLAMLAWKTAKRPQLAHLLWLLVFIKLVTPPVKSISIPVLPAQTMNAEAPAGSLPPQNAEHPGLNGHAGSAASVTSGNDADGWHQAKNWLIAIWILGSAAVFALSMIRVYRFGRLLKSESEDAPTHVQLWAARMARRLKLKKIPAICTTSAHLSPMVWWAGLKVRIIMPAALLTKLEPEQCQWVLAHELAHVRRRDHLVRWLEWLACVLFWWNPVMWWAQRNLRATEEICCDQLVMSRLKPQPYFYANSLFATVEYLASPVVRPPAMASEINSGGCLERRFKMIMSKNQHHAGSRRLQTCVLLCLLALLPFGVVFAQDYEAVGKRLREAVQAGELTPAQARIMMAALKNASQEKEREATSGPRAKMEHIEKEIRKAVAEGKITPEEGRKKMQAIKKKFIEAARKKQPQPPRKPVQDKEREVIRQRLEAAEKGIRKAIAEGKITKEQGREKMRAIHKKIIEAARKKKEQPKQAELEGIRRRRMEAASKAIQKAVQEGKITPEQGREKLQALRKRFAEAVSKHRAQPKKAPAGRDSVREGIKGRLEAASKAIQRAVIEGKITPEQGREKMRAIRKKILEAVRKSEAKTQEGHLEDRKREAIRRHMEAAGKKIRKAVEEGKITPEEGRAKWAALKKSVEEKIKKNAGERTKKEE